MDDKSGKGVYYQDIDSIEAISNISIQYQLTTIEEIAQIQTIVGQLNED